MMFGFYVLFWSFAIALSLAIIIGIPCLLFGIPYSMWLGVKQNRGLYLDKELKFPHSLKDAAKVYGSWITHKEPKI